jgi:hypothetical protein
VGVPFREEIKTTRERGAGREKIERGSREAARTMRTAIPRRRMEREVETESIQKQKMQGGADS